jgi:hypothetical protein
MKRSRDVYDTVAAASSSIIVSTRECARNTHTRDDWDGDVRPLISYTTLSHTHRHRNVRQIGFRSSETSYIVKQRYRNAYVYKYDTI